MAITTYTELITATVNWITRSDENFEDRVAECIALAEGVANRVLDCRQMYARNAAFAISGATVALPSGFAGVRAFKLNTALPTPLFYVKADDFDDPREAGYEGVGAPRKYTMIGDNFLFSPSPDSAYTATLVYRQNLTPLSDDDPSNWLLAAYPDAYLSGTLAFAYQFIEDNEMEAKFMANFLSSLEQINTLDSRMAYGSSPTRRVRGFA